MLQILATIKRTTNRYTEKREQKQQHQQQQQQQLQHSSDEKTATAKPQPGAPADTVDQRKSEHMVGHVGHHHKHHPYSSSSSGRGSTTPPPAPAETHDHLDKLTASRLFLDVDTANNKRPISLKGKTYIGLTGVRSPNGVGPKTSTPNALTEKREPSFKGSFRPRFESVAVER